MLAMFSSYFFSINIPNTELPWNIHSDCSVSVIDEKAEVKLSLHLLSANKLSLVSHLSWFVSLPSEKSTPANCSKLYVLSLCVCSNWLLSGT